MARQERWRGEVTVTGPPIPKSGCTGIYWPATPAPIDAMVLALQHQLEQSEWWSAETLLAHQLAQLERLLGHAVATVPFYRRRLKFLAGIKRGGLTPEVLRRVPVLSRADIQEAGDALVSTRVPEDHGTVGEVRTSGSTGSPVTVRHTAVTGLFYRAINLRHHVWHGRDFTAKTARVTHVTAADSRPQAWVAGYPSGPMVTLPIGHLPDEQLAWLAKEAPQYLLTYPSNLRTLLQRAEETGAPLPSLREAATIGEIVDADVRDLCRRVWGVPVVDAYSSQEVGMIALQCPEHPHYHVQAESLLVEVLDNDGKPCGPGAVGRIVVTDLHNFASPLIRYAVGDYAEVGAPCPCGRGLPVLAAVLGRARNMLVLPSGERVWPTFGSRTLPDIAPIVQHQFVQKSLDTIEARFVTRRPLTAEEEEKLRVHILSRLPVPFQVLFTYHDGIPRSAGGKFEDFMCEVRA